MPAKNVWEELEALRRRVHNVKPWEIENLAKKAGWVWQNTTGSHATYVKEGFPSVLTIKLHRLGGDLARSLLRIIESSLYEEERASDGDQEGD
jgi:predicted RNA binding protein YcfA (HicA-like mRNA interferase family)